MKRFVVAISLAAGYFLNFGVGNFVTATVPVTSESVFQDTIPISRKDSMRRNDSTWRLKDSTHPRNKYDSARRKDTLGRKLNMRDSTGMNRDSLNRKIKNGNKRKDSVQ